MKIVVIGGSGLIGKKLVAMLREKGHDVLPASPSTGVNAFTGEGLDDLVRKLFSATKDSREVVTDPKAGYFGTPIDDQSLTPLGESHLGRTRYEDWLSRSQA